MADISKITLPSGTSYDIKDATARSDIADIKSSTPVVCTISALQPLL